MTKISKKTAYPLKKPIQNDYFVGTDSENFGKTVNFDFGDVTKVMNILNGISPIGYTFKTSGNILLDVLTEAEFYSLGNETTIAEVTKFYINKFDKNAVNLANLYNYLLVNSVDFLFKLRGTDPNVYVYFNLTSIENHSDYYLFNVTLYKGNAVLPELTAFGTYFFDFELKGTGSDVFDLQEVTSIGNHTTNNIVLDNSPGEYSTYTTTNTITDQGTFQSYISGTDIDYQSVYAGYEMSINEIYSPTESLEMFISQGNIQTSYTNGDNYNAARLNSGNNVNGASLYIEKNDINGQLKIDNLSANITLQFPNKTVGTYTIATTSDIVSPALVFSNEGNGNGIVISGRNPLNYGNVGLNAIDLSYNDSSSSTWGALGENSFTFGSEITSNNYGSISFGYNIFNNGINSFNNGYTHRDAGYTNFLTGSGHDVTSINTTVVGQASNIISTQIVDFNVTTTKPLFVVGNGTIHNTDFSVLTRSDAFIVRMNGLAALPSVTNALIEADTTGKAVVTKEYMNSKISSATPTLQQVITAGAAATSPFSVSINSAYEAFTATNPTGTALYGDSNYGVGVGAYSNYGDAVQAESYQGIGVRSISNAGIAIQAQGNGSISIQSLLGQTGKGLVLASSTASTGNPLEVTKNSVLKAKIDQSGNFSGGAITASSFTLSGLNTAPSSSTDAGTLGEIRYDAHFMYLCVATNTWKRSALTAW